MHDAHLFLLRQNFQFKEGYIASNRLTNMSYNNHLITQVFSLAKELIFLLKRLVGSTPPKNLLPRSHFSFFHEFICHTEMFQIIKKVSKMVGSLIEGKKKV